MQSDAPVIAGPGQLWGRKMDCMSMSCLGWGTDPPDHLACKWFRDCGCECHAPH